MRGGTLMMGGSGVACFLSLALAVNLFAQGSLKQANSAQGQAAKAEATTTAQQALQEEDETARGRFEQGCVFLQQPVTGKPLSLTQDLNLSAYGDGAIVCDRLGKTAVVQGGKLTSLAVIQNWNAYRTEKAARVQRNIQEGRPVPQQETTLRSN